MGFPRRRADGPCESYFGNVCTGFGAEAVCMLCGWDRVDHLEVRERTRRLFGDVLAELERRDRARAVGGHG